MPTNVVMPQMGESVAEGTVVRWLKHVGDPVDRDEPLFEISTDKVDAEIPAPAAGVLAEIRVREGETVPVDSVVAIIVESGAAATVPGTVAAVPASAAVQTPAPSRPMETTSAATPAAAAVAAAAPAGVPPEGPAPATASESVRRQRLSPVVRRIAREHGVDVNQVAGTGIGGRVTKHDILDFIARRAPQQPALARAEARGPETVAAAAPASRTPQFQPGEDVSIAPMSVMRKRIAEHMIMSRRTSAHVHSVFEVDFLRVSKLREQVRADYERLGVKLTYLPFIVKAAAEALRAVPVVNASIDGDSIVYKRRVNIGIAVALEWGLIVPVIKDADEKNILGLSRAIADLAQRARTKQLKPDEVQGGTFSITNPGGFGALMGAPIINQPQVAILGIGAIEKRAVVVDDMIAIRPRGYLTLGYDHRLIDGAVADEFMSVVKRRLEQFDAAGL